MIGRSPFDRSLHAPVLRGQPAGFDPRGLIVSGKVKPVSPGACPPFGAAEAGEEHGIGFSPAEDSRHDD